MDGRRVGGLAVLSLLLVAGSVQAGPVISWGYSSTLVPIGGAEWYPGVVTTLQNIHSQYVSKVSGEAGGAKSGWQTVQVGTVSPTDGGGDPLANIATDYRLTLMLTDAASGQTGSVSYTGRAAEDVIWVGEAPFQQPTDRHAWVYGLTPEGDETLTLGGNEYRVSVVGRRGDDGNAYLDATVRVGPASEAPEPGTLALAAVALAGGVGVWRRKRVG